MNFWNRIAEKLDKDVSFRTLIKIIMILLVVLLIRSTDVVWKGIWVKFRVIIRPFFLGFAGAYVIHPLILWLEKKKISRRVSIPVVYILILVLLLWLTFTIIPMVISRLSSFITSMITGVNSLYDAYAGIADDVPNWLQEAVRQIIASLNNALNLLPNLTSQLPDLLNSAFAEVTNFILTFIISIYMCLGYDKTKVSIRNLMSRFGDPAVRTCHAIDLELGSYIRSLIVLMLVRFAEYCLVYSIVRHPDWLLMGLLTAISLIIPYIGPTIVNVIGIVTALELPSHQVILLVALILILSQVDAYLIEPMVHSHNVRISPLWALFSIFAGGVLLGPEGVVFGIPIYLAIRAAIETNSSAKKKEETA